MPTSASSRISRTSRRGSPMWSRRRSGCRCRRTSSTSRSAKLDGQAREAMSAGREDLARAALERKQMITQETGSLDQQVSELESQQEKLTAAEQQLQAKIEQFRSKKEVIKAQYSAAEAQVQISEAATGVGDSMADVGMAMQRAIDKTDQMQARASAVEELQAAGTFDDLTALGPPQDDVDRQLDELGGEERGRRRARAAQGRGRTRRPTVRPPRGRVRHRRRARGRPKETGS